MARLQLDYRPLDSFQAYEMNPRDNRAAVHAVKESIQKFGFRIPVVIDPNGVIVTGHTRIEAMKELRREDPTNEEWQEVPCFVAGDLTEDQLRAFRLVDNKVASIASWDFDKLAEEVSALVEVGIDLVPYGWTREELDCLTSVVNADCLSEEFLNDGIQAAHDSGQKLSAHRDGQSVRISIADLAFYVLREDYDEWADRLRREHNYDLDALLDHLAENMGLLEAKRRRLEVLARGGVAEETDEPF